MEIIDLKKVKSVSYSGVANEFAFCELARRKKNSAFHSFTVKLENRREVAVKVDDNAMRKALLFLTAMHSGKGGIFKNGKTHKN